MSPEVDLIDERMVYNSLLKYLLFHFARELMSLDLAKYLLFSIVHTDYTNTYLPYFDDSEFYLMNLIMEAMMFSKIYAELEKM